MRTAIEERFKPQLSELTEKYKPFEPYQDRVSDVQSALDLNDKLFGAYERDEETGQLIPATQQFAEVVSQRDPLVADLLTADLLNGTTRHPDTGREVPRIDIALEGIAADPEMRQRALAILGAVEPSAVAPTWAPTPEELEVVKPELQAIYRTLPYDEREQLKLNDPEFINRYLASQKFQQDLVAENQRAQELQAQQQQQQLQFQRQQAENAGNQYVEQQFKTGFTEFANSIVERAKFIAPLDAQTAEAQGLAPEQVAQYNQQAQQINLGVGKMIATVTAALSHPDTAWVAADFLQSLGVNPQVIADFDRARQEFAQNARYYGELSFSQKDAPGLGTVQSNATRAMTQMKGRGNLVAQPLLKLMSDFFQLKAGSYNQTLNSTAAVRPPVNGSAYDPTTAVAQRPQRSPDQLWSREAIERIAY